MSDEAKPATICLAVFMDGDDYHVVCVGSESQCKSAVREYGHANARQQRGRDEDTRVFRKQQKHGKTTVRGSFDIQEWPLGGVDPHWSVKVPGRKSFFDAYPYKVLCSFAGDGKECKR